MSRTDLAWLAVAAYALHILEERILDWQSSARKQINLSMERDDYVIIEIVLLILGAVAAMLVGSQPVFALAFAVFLVINVTFFHLLPMILAGGKFSPGVITGIVLFYPLAWKQYQLTGTTPQETLIWAVVIGAAIILWPVLLLKLRKMPYFRQGGRK
jgi:hypothetical protein